MGGGPWPSAHELGHQRYFRATARVRDARFGGWSEHGGVMPALWHQSENRLQVARAFRGRRGGGVAPEAAARRAPGQSNQPAGGSAGARVAPGPTDVGAAQTPAAAG